MKHHECRNVEPTIYSANEKPMASYQFRRGNKTQKAIISRVICVPCDGDEYVAESGQ